MNAILPKPLPPLSLGRGAVLQTAFLCPVCDPSLGSAPMQVTRVGLECMLAIAMQARLIV